MVKNSPARAGDIRDAGKRGGLDPWLGKVPWRRKWQPIPVFLPGKLYGQRGLAGYSLWGYKELDLADTHQWAHPHPKI